jgi:hypothetical protein
MQMLANEIKNFLIPEPGGGVLMDLQSCRLEVNQVATILQGRDIRVERAPVVGHDGDHVAGRIRNGIASSSRSEVAECRAI